MHLKTTWKRATALIIAVLMSVTMMPSEALNALGLPSEAKAAGKTILDADELEVTGDLEADYDLGSGFTLLANSAKKGAVKTIASLTSDTDGSYQHADGLDKTFSNTVRLTGGGIAANSSHVVNAIKFSISDKATVSVYAALKSKSTNATRTLKIFKASNDDSELGELAKESSALPVPVEQVSLINKYSFELTDIGSYYVGFSGDGGIIPYIEIDEGEEPAEYVSYGKDGDEEDGILDFRPTEEGDIFEGFSASTALADGSYGELEKESDYGTLTFTNSSGAQNRYHGSTYGVCFVDGGSLTIEPGEGQTIETITLPTDKNNASGAENGVSLKIDNGDATEIQSLYVEGQNYNDYQAQVVSFGTEDSPLAEGAVYTLTFSGANYIPYIMLTGMKPAPAVEEVTVKVTTTDSPEGVLGDFLVFLVNNSDDTDIYDVTGLGNEDVTLKNGATYKAVVCESEEDLTPIGSLDAKINDAATVKITPATESLTVVVTSTILAVTPTFSGDTDKLGTNLVLLTGGGEEYVVTSGQIVRLPKNTEFTVRVVKPQKENDLYVDAENWTAKVSDSNKFTTSTDESQAITIALKCVSKINVTATLTGDGLLGDNILVLTNTEDAEDTHELEFNDENTATVELEPNSTYGISFKTPDATLVCTVNGEATFATQLEDEEIAVDVSTPSTKNRVWDFSSNTARTFAVDDELDGGGAGIIVHANPANKKIDYEAKQLRFRQDVELYLPISATATKATFALTCSGTNAGRPTYVGSKDSGFTVEMSTVEQTVTLDDVADYVVEYNGKKYLPIISGGDIKPTKMRLVEYEPVNAVTVTGTVDGAHDLGVTGLIFKNLLDETKLPIEAAVEDNDSYEVVLRRVAGKALYGVTAVGLPNGKKINDEDDADKIALSGNGPTATQNFTIADAPQMSVSGTFTGVPDAAIVGDGLGVELVPDNTAMEHIPLTLTKVSNGNYTYAAVDLEIGRRYSVALTNADDYLVADEIVPTGEDGGNYTANIAATAKPTFAVSGKFVTSNGKNSAVTKLTFTNMEDDRYHYEATVTGSTYTINLRDADYAASVTPATFEAFDHVHVEGAAVTNDVYLIGAADTTAVAYKEEVTVGEGKEYPTITKALDAIARMTRNNGERVTIKLSDNTTYREQVIVTQPNITFKGGENSKVTWYYGVGFSYYSAKPAEDGKNGSYYDEAYAVDRYEKTLVSQNPGHWGATVNLFPAATGFRAEDVIFENSLNLYLTEEELADGAAANTSGAITDRTTANIDVTSYNAKERSCALYIQADNTEYKNCQFLSRQDTLYTGDANESSYFRDCSFLGTVDYICGDGNAVFDSCEQQIYGYPGDKYANYAGAIITANKATADHGYLFLNNRIVDAKKPGTGATTAYVLSRAWAAGTVYWLNTEVENATAIASDKPYLDMNATAADAHYYEYNTHYMADGVATPIDTSHRTAGYEGTILSDEEYAAIEVTEWFDDWLPGYYPIEGKVIQISEIPVTVTSPAAGVNRVDAVATTTHPALQIEDFKWYTEDENGEDVEFEGETFERGVVYTARFNVALKNSIIYEFTENAQARVPAGSAETKIAADKKSAEVSVAFVSGIYNIDLTQGLVTGQNYITDPMDGSLTVMSDMPYKADTGVVKGSVNPKNSENKGPTDDNPEPVKGTVLVIETPADDGAINQLTVSSRASGKTFYLVQMDGSTAVIADKFTGSSVADTRKYSLEPETKYYFFASGSNQEISSIKYEHRQVRNRDWSLVAIPTVSDPEWTLGEDRITVKASGAVGLNGKYDDAESLEVDMLDASGAVVDTKVTMMDQSANEETEFTFSPATSGNYTFVARLVRAGEKDKKSARSAVVEFVHSLSAPVITAVTNKSDGTTGRLEAIWEKVPEARKYQVSVWVNEPEDATDTLDFTDGSIVATTTTGRSDTGESEHVNVAIACGPSNIYQYHGTTYGVVFKTGNKISITPKTGCEVSSITLPCDNNTNGSVTLSLGETALPEGYEATRSLIETENGHGISAGNQSEVVFEEMGVADVYELTFDGNSNYIPYIKVACQEDSWSLSGTPIETTRTETMIEDLVVGTTAMVEIKAIRASEEDSSSTTSDEIAVTGKTDMTWAKSAYGSNAKSSEISMSGKALNNDPIVINALTSSTKLVPGSTDGLGFYYARLGKDDNFSLTAKMSMNQYGFDNGQDGFGIMAADAVGENNNSEAFWNNSYQVLASKFTYNWDPTIQDDDGNYVGGLTTATHVSEPRTIFRNEMKLGIGWTEKTGVTLADTQRIAAGEIVAPPNWGSGGNQGTLEHFIPDAVMASIDTASIVEGLTATLTEANNALPEDERMSDDELQAVIEEEAVAAIQTAYRETELTMTGGDKRDTWNTYNVILSKDDGKAASQKNYADTPVSAGVGEVPVQTVSTVVFQIRRDNSGYQMIYADEEGGMTFNPFKGPGVSDEEAAAALNDALYKDFTWVKLTSKGVTTYYPVVEKKQLYDDSRTALSQIDKNYIYVGFLAARKVKATAEEYELITDKMTNDDGTMVDPSLADPARPKEKEKVALVTRVYSATSSNSKDYQLVYSANADGKLNITQTMYPGTGAETTKVVAQGYSVTSGKQVSINTKLSEGNNVFTIKFTPDADYAPGDTQELIFPAGGSKTEEYTVTWKTFKGAEGNILYAGPTANGDKDGTSPANRLDIYTAVAYAKPGQTIYLAGGHYDLHRVLRLERGNDGEEGYMIRMMTDPVDLADPEKGRAVLDFTGATENKPGMTIVSSYWYFKDFDVTGSTNGNDGILLAGKNNVLENLQTYMNGNTGLQIARDGSDGRALWPAYNTVLNCTSFLNYDAGFEDADGFAAKLTCGEGNRFVGCVAAFNADDGWDLFAKVQTGAIGAVTIDNCVAYKNGYLLGYADDPNKPGVYEIFYETGHELTKVIGDKAIGTAVDPVELKAGNGNGFKMGGDGLSGKHVLKNSVAFDNKSNGIDSNSCPDIRVYNSTSYRNGTNVALTNYATSVNSDYDVSGLLSVTGGNKDSVSVLGNQSRIKLFNDTNYWTVKGGKSAILETDGKTVKNQLPAIAQVFVSVDPADAGASGAQWTTGKFINRKANGSIELGDFLKLKDEFAQANPGIGADPADTDPEEVIVSGSQKVAVYAGAVTKLFEVLLPEDLQADYQWKYPETPIAQFVGTSAEFAYVAKGGQANEDKEEVGTVIVHFIDLIGATLTMNREEGKLIGADDEILATLSPVIEPAIDLADFKDDIQSGTFNDNGFTYDFGAVQTLTITAADYENDDLSQDFTIAPSDRAKDTVQAITANVRLTSGRKKIVKSVKTNIIIWTGDDEPAFSGDLEDDDGETTGDIDGIRSTPNGDPKNFRKFYLKNVKVTGVRKANGTPNEDVNVSVLDTKVLGDKKEKEGNEVVHTFEVKAPGVTSIVLKAAGDAKVIKQIPVTVTGNDYAVSVSTLTVDRALSTGTSFNVISPTGAPTDGLDLAVASVKRSATAKDEATVKANIYDLTGKATGKEDASLKDMFVVDHDIANIYTIGVVGYEEWYNDNHATDYAGIPVAPVIPAGTYYVTLTDGASDFDQVIVKVTESKPAVTLKQTKKVNLYYQAATAESTGILTATSKQAKVTVEQINEVPAQGESNALKLQQKDLNTHFTLAAADDGYTITVDGESYDQYTDPNVKPAFRFNTRIPVRVTYQNYKAYTAKDMWFNVVTETRAPRYKLIIDSPTLYPMAGVTNTLFRILDQDTNLYVSGAEVDLAGKDTVRGNTVANIRANENFWIGQEGTDYTLNLNDETKGGAAKIAVYDPNFGKDRKGLDNFVLLNAPITVNKTKPAVTFEAVKLNSLKQYAGKEAAFSKITVRGTLGATVTDFELTPANKNSEALMPYLYYDITSKDEAGYEYLKVMLQDGDTKTLEQAIADGTVKKGAYSYKATYMIGNATDTKTIPVTLQETQRVTTKVKGNLELLDRTGSYLEFIPALTGLSGTVTSMRLGNDVFVNGLVTRSKLEYGADSLFDVDPDSMTVWLKANGSYRFNGSYKITPVYTVSMDGGDAEIVGAPVTIRVKQTAVKFETLPVLETKLYDINMPAIGSMKALAPANVEVLELQQQTQLENFAVEYDPASGAIAVYITDVRGLKAGTTYTINLGVVPLGAGNGTKQQVVSVKVKVLN